MSAKSHSFRIAQTQPLNVRKGSVSLLTSNNRHFNSRAEFYTFHFCKLDKTLVDLLSEVMFTVKPVQPVQRVERDRYIAEGCTWWHASFLLGKVRNFCNNDHNIMSR